MHHAEHVPDGGVTFFQRSEAFSAVWVTAKTSETDSGGVAQLKVLRQGGRSLLSFLGKALSVARGTEPLVPFSPFLPTVRMPLTAFPVSLAPDAKSSESRLKAQRASCVKGDLRLAGRGPSSQSRSDHPLLVQLVIARRSACPTQALATGHARTFSSLAALR